MKINSKKLEVNTNGGTSGSRVEFVNEKDNGLYIMHKPHSGDIIKGYMTRTGAFLKGEGICVLHGTSENAEKNIVTGLFLAGKNHKVIENSKEKHRNIITNRFNPNKSEKMTEIFNKEI